MAPRTPDSLDSALKELRELTERELDTVSSRSSKSKEPSQPSPQDSSSSTADVASSSYEGAPEMAPSRHLAISESSSYIQEISALSEQLVAEERWETALAVVTEQHELLCSVLGEHDARTLQVLGTYAGVLWQLGRASDAWELLEELVSKREKVRFFFGGNITCARAQQQSPRTPPPPLA